MKHEHEKCLYERTLIWTLPFRYSQQNEFDPRGMQAAVNRFQEIGCRQIFVVVPRNRMGEDRLGIMQDLQRQNILSITPSRKVYDERLGRNISQTPYDDR